MTADVSFGERSLAVRAYVPEGLAVIRGVLVFTGGQASAGMSGDTRGVVEQRFYQRFAESTGFALLGNQFSGSYTDAANGPGQALLDALAALGDKSGHPELARAPLLLHGFSNGGYFSFTFAAWKPERVIAFSLNKSGFARAPLSAAFLAVPGVLFWGEKEVEQKLPTVIHGLVQQGRREHALWAELKEWGRGHEDGEVQRVFVPFFAEMIAARYPKGKSPLDAAVPLIALEEAKGWLGDHSDASLARPLPQAAAFAAYGGDKANASWLPSEALANVWRGFVTQQPLALAAPENAAELDASQGLALRASGLSPDERASFLDGARTLAGPLAADGGGNVEANWQPEWGGARAILAAAYSGDELTRLSRPAAVLLYGKAPPPDPREPEPSVDPADAGPGDADRDDAGDVVLPKESSGCSAVVAAHRVLPSKLAWVLFALVLRRRFARRH